MITIAALLFGTLLIVAGVRGNASDLWDTLTGEVTRSGYAKIGFISYAVGLTIAALPLFAIKNKNQADAYTALIILSILIYHYDALGRFVSDLNYLK